MCALVPNILGLAPPNGHTQHTIPTKDITVDSDSERATFQFPFPFAKGTQFILRIHYRGTLTNTGIGYSLSEWQKEGEARVRRYAKTMFQVRPTCLYASRPSLIPIPSPSAPEAQSRASTSPRLRRPSRYP